MDIPGISYGVQKDYKTLYYSDPIAALKREITLQAGYGLVEQGTVLAVNKSAAGNVAKHVPYNPTSFTGKEVHPGRAYIVGGGVNATYTVNVTLEDSYKFSVGDDIIINDNTTTAENLGAITAIDRTTYSSYAVITFTTVIGGTAFTTARFAYIAIEAGDNTNNYSDAVGILEKSVDTGTGVNAKGAVATMILGNCLLYTGMLTNLDAAAITDLSAVATGRFTMIR
jgi:hypothetical protein